MKIGAQQAARHAKVANTSDTSFLLAEEPAQGDSAHVCPAAAIRPEVTCVALVACVCWFSRRGRLWRLLLAAIGLGVHFQRRQVIAIPPSPRRAVPGKPGTWGQLEYRTIKIDLPDEFVFVPPPNQPPVRWFFHGSNREQATEFLKSAGMAPAQLAIIEKAKWTPDPRGVVVEPGDDFILSLAADARAKIYSQLVEYDENSRQIDPVWFEKDRVDDRLKDSGLLPSSIELLKTLLYPQGDSLLLFADFEPALRRLPNDGERRLFMNAVSRKRTVLAGLHITAESNMESIIDYWGAGGRKKERRLRCLRALRHENDSKINIVCLLAELRPRPPLHAIP